MTQRTVAMLMYNMVQVQFPPDNNKEKTKTKTRPVPGGVGLTTVAMLMYNTVQI